MSYKHNNLMAMRQRYWDDTESSHVNAEKALFQQLLVETEIFPAANLDDAKQLFFSLPSIILIQGYAKGFNHEAVQNLIRQHINTHRDALQQKQDVKIKFKI
ncbi:hypothetical protein [Acinetobacter tianfuensis]|uniref:Uncharacterized protein n=1 Tax=Acinetobacter tianfuensis TaxID=2419603 RepID=A0A3A8EJI2_9GAMM|nr:hypothetical protein [Acinetobacter tianfuensis]RKG30900.1 hypothetical protein D7V32_09555 [Acinetobacter tianfuensis]